jgi:predicted site-specific integrase-resolvase
MTYYTLSDIERITGVRKSTLAVWKHRGKLPAPDYMPNQKTPLWNPKTIDKWAKENGYGRPR